MSKRFLAILLIIVGVLAIIGVLYWTFRPTLKNRLPEPSGAPSEPAAASESVSPTPSLTPPPSTGAPAAPPLSSTEEQEQQLLRNRASAFVARQGSYTNSDNFIAMRDVYLDVSPTVRAFYESEERRLNQEHPTAQGTWVQTVRALSSKIVSDTPVAGKSQAVVSVQAQQITEAGTTPAVLSYREFMVSFTRDQGRWIVTRIESKPLEL